MRGKEAVRFIDRLLGYNRGCEVRVLSIVKPQHFLPIHGELLFLKDHELFGISGMSLQNHHTNVVGACWYIFQLRDKKHAGDMLAVLRTNLLTLAYEVKLENKALKERLLPSWSFSSSRVKAWGYIPGEQDSTWLESEVREIKTLQHSSN